MLDELIEHGEALATSGASVRLLEAMRAQVFVKRFEGRELQFAELALQAG